MKADALVADLADQEDRLAGRLVHGQGMLIAAERGFDGLAHLVFGPEEAVCRHAATNALVGAEVVVVGDEVGQPLLGFGQLLRLYPAPELLANSLPKALTLAQRFWVVCPRDHVLDALLL
jgi:hypothetical protein